MNPLMLIKGELRRSFGGILALALVLALSLSLGVGVSMTERAVRQGTARAGDAFDLLVGAQGSSVQLMLGAVYLRPQSLPLVPGGAVTEILTQEGVVWAAPLAFGDRWNASPLVGTTTDMVTLGGNRTLAEGRAFAAQDEAVLGAGVPLRLGEAFSPMHGQVSASHNEHGHVRYKAVGACRKRARRGTTPSSFPSNRSGPSTMRFPMRGMSCPSGIFLKGRVPRCPAFPPWSSSPKASPPPTACGPFGRRRPSQMRTAGR